MGNFVLLQICDIPLKFQNLVDKGGILVDLGG